MEAMTESSCECGVDRTPGPFRIGWESAKANGWPMVILWSLAALLVAAYYSAPRFAEALESVRRIQSRHELLTPFVAQMVFSGLIPGIFLMCWKRPRPRHPLAVALFQGVWCGCWGIVCNAVFRLQAALFGEGCDLGTVLCKMVVDQFAWTPLVIAPANAVFFFWLSRDFSLSRCRADWPKGFWRSLVAPNLFANWMVWIPVSLAVFSFPRELQIHMNGLACSFWVLLAFCVGGRSAPAKGSPPVSGGQHGGTHPATDLGVARKTN